MKKCDSGDVLLFKTKKLSAKITRGVTQSEYDHVAMVLKFEGEEEAYIIDATLDGVNITSWTDLWTYKDSLYKKIVWRQLKIIRDDMFISVSLLPIYSLLLHNKYKIN